MMWLLMCAGLLWLLGWMFFIARATAPRDADAQVKMFGSVLPAFTAITLLLVFTVVHERGPLFKVILWIHHLGIFSLFIFLSAAQLFQVQAFWQIKGELSTVSVATTMRRLWVLTEMAPAAIALSIFLTGLRMIWESPIANSPDALWLMALILTFSVFFFDGIMGYQPIVRKMLGYWVNAAESETPVKAAATAWRSSLDRLQLFAHFLSWPFVFMLGVFRWNPQNSLSPQVVRLEHCFATLPDGWPGVVTALILWASVGVLVAVVRIPVRFLRSRALENF